MPTIDIPDINIPEIYIPDVPEIYSPHYLTITKPPDIDVPGCTYQHRDIKNTGNRNLLLEDPKIMNHRPYQKQSSQRFLIYLNHPHQIFLPVLVKMTKE